MNAKAGIFLRLLPLCLCLLPRLAAGQGSIGPLQNLRSFSLAGPRSFVQAGDLAFFTVTPPTDSESLWRTDGTAQGTFQLVTTGSFPPNQGFRFWTVQGSRLFFTGRRTPEPSETHRALWRSDGTVEGTVSLTQAMSFAIDASAGASPTSLAVPETGVVFFSAGAESAQPDYELWATDGTAEGTRLVKDVNPEGPSKPGFMVTLGGQLFFIADTPQGSELWRSDGTPEGTERVESLHHLGAGVVALTRAGGALFLLAETLAETAAGVELWRSDGTEAGTSRVLELPASRLLGYAAAGRRFFLAVGDASLQDKELWVAEGGTGETVQVLDTAAPGELKLLAFGDGALFALSEAGHGLEPWLSDGTPGGTRRIADICPGPCDSSPVLLGIYAGRALLLADDGDSGREPWSSNGTAAGTYRVGDLCPGECSPALGGRGEVAGWLALGAGNRIWLSDGSQDGAFPVAQFSAALATMLLPPLADRLLIMTTDPAFTLGLWSLPVTAPAPPPGGWLESARVPGFRFKVQIGGQTAGRQESACMARTLCVSGALPGRSEVFLRVPEPGSAERFGPALVKLATSAVDVWVLQTATGHLRHYRLNGSGPAGSTLPGILDRAGFRNVPGALAAAAGEAKAPRDPQPPGRWIESKTVPGFRVQARLTLDGKSQVLRKEPCIAETFCLSGATPGTPGITELLVRVTGPKPNRHFWTMLARFAPATLEVWVQQRKTGKIRYYRLNAPPAGSSQLDGYVDRQGFKR
ncbi:MAG TPA: hypothetical protein VN493_14975 [Thermoanaerobaculia bacterium]|nr:hypothetical protein [Thermoanaerobaculia bacterium]